MTLLRECVALWFGQYQWARRFAGGHWELWGFAPPVPPIAWVQHPRRTGHVQRCSREIGFEARPGLGRDLLACEDWPDKGGDATWYLK